SRDHRPQRAPLVPYTTLFRSTARSIFERIRAEIFGESLKTGFRVSKEHFTRNRKQHFPLLLLFMMNFLKKSLSLEIENFTALFRSEEHTSELQSRENLVCRLL